MAQRYGAGVARLEQILARLQSTLGELTGEPQPLSGGITNDNFRVTLDGEDYVVRIHGRDTDLLGIDREAELIACGLAAELGIAPELVASFDDCLVTRFVACDPVVPHEVAAHVTQIARALRSFHDSPARLPARFWVPELLEDYSEQVRVRGVRLPSDYGRAAAVASRIADALPLRDPRPCHNDLLSTNIIRAHATGERGGTDADGNTGEPAHDSGGAGGGGGGGGGGGRMLIVDWEYAGMGHRYFDLGNLSVNNDFDEAADEQLLRGYHGRPPTDAERAALALMRILSDAREGAWGVVQTEISELDFDFARYARLHFERLNAAAELPQVSEWLAVAAADENTPQESDGQTA
jgi:thiamine kinase-like enzyme